MKTAPRNISASIQARLSNKAKSLHKDYEEVLQYYGMERFLYRLSKTKYSDDLVLKGGLVFYGLGVPLRRPTRDIDFLGTAQEMGGIVSEIIAEAISVQVPEDGILFDGKSLKIDRTQIDADRNGFRVRLTGLLGRSKIPLQIDIGLSDELSLDIIDIDFPALLPGMEYPRLKGYPSEFIISEKFQAMVRLADINSRWKDYYDIWLLSESYRFEITRLKQSIKTTFDKRSTPLPRTRPLALGPEFVQKHNPNWQLFLARHHLTRDEIREFVDVADKIWTFLDLPLQELAESTKSSTKIWIPGKGWK